MKDLFFTKPEIAVEKTNQGGFGESYFVSVDFERLLQGGNEAIGLPLAG